MFDLKNKKLILFILVWSLFTFLSFVWNSYQEDKRIFQLATMQAQALVTKDVLYRKWNASLGGVWADKNKVSPNPYLEDMVDNRDIRSVDGFELTMVNPAYMSRLVFELQKDEMNVHSQMTSLNPVNPSNKPDEWEKKALEILEQRSDSEVKEIVSIDGVPTLRYLRELIVEKPCLKCHEKQGYKLGQVRGGISTIVSLSPFIKNAKDNQFILGWTHFTIWLVGCIGITVGFLNWKKKENARQLADDALQESRAHFRLVVDSAMESIITMNQQGNVIDFNEMAGKQFGYTKEEAIGKTLSELVIPPRYREAHRIGLERYNKTNKSDILGHRIELTAQNKDGVEFPVELTITESKSHDGEKFFIGFMHDISERLKRENQLVEARNLAETANNAKSRFLANMSHELRTPMHAIHSFTKLAMKREIDDKAKHFLENIETSTRRLTDLLNDLLDLSKLEAGKMEIELGMYDLSEIVSQSIKHIESLIQSKSLKINLLKNDSAYGEFDKKLIFHVITNLLSNAIKFSPEKGVISMQTTSHTIEGVAYLGFSIQDQGLGIPKEELNSIFNAFVQSSTTMTNAGGTGLGLPICKEIIEIHHGEIWAESPPHGKESGSVFTFRIPIHQPDNRTN